MKQREKEMQSAIFAKLSSGSSIDSHVLRLIHRDSTISNEVSRKLCLSKYRLFSYKPSKLPCYLHRQHPNKITHKTDFLSYLQLIAI